MAKSQNCPSPLVKFSDKFRSPSRELNSFDFALVQQFVSRPSDLDAGHLNFTSRSLDPGLLVEKLEPPTFRSRSLDPDFFI